MLTPNALITNPAFWDDPRITALPIVQRFILLGLASLIVDRPLIMLDPNEAVQQLKMPSGYPAHKLLKELQDLDGKALLRISIDGGLVEVDLAPMRGLFARPNEADGASFNRQVRITGNVSALSMALKKPNADPYRLHVEQIQVDERDVGLLSNLVRENRLELVLRELPSANAPAHTLVSTPTQQPVDPWTCDDDSSEIEDCTMDEEQTAEYMKSVKSSRTLIPIRN